MNWSEMEQSWEQGATLCGTHWPKLTTTHLCAIAGKRAELARCLREAYGYSDEEAENDISGFELDCRRPGAVK